MKTLDLQEKNNTLLLFSPFAWYNRHMKIGIDVSQLAYSRIGVANYLKNLVLEMVKQGKDNEFVLFFSSMRGKIDEGFVKELKGANVTLKTFKYPPVFLDLIWNRFHIFPIENFIGDIDIFVTSDWTEPPAKRAKKATILYDLIVYKYPKETAKKIISVQKRKLKWVKKESTVIFAISNSAKKDAEKILGLGSEKVRVIYPGA